MMRHWQWIWTIFLGIHAHSQVSIIGYAPQFKNKPFQLWEESDFLSKSKVVIAETTCDERGIFRFTLPPQGIKHLFVGTGQNYSFFYVQDKAQYRIEFIADNPQNESYNLKEEIELTFIDLDSNDINFKILGFDAWIDASMEELHFSNQSSGEVLRKISLMKIAAAKDLMNDTSAYFQDYTRYSIAFNLDNLNYFGAPSQKEKFESYFKNRSIAYKAPFYGNYFLSFYDKFLSYLRPEDVQALFAAFASVNIEKQQAILKNYQYLTGEDELQSVILLFTLKQSLNNSFLPKSVIRSNFEFYRDHSPYPIHRSIASNLIERMELISVGNPFPLELLKLDKHQINPQSFKDKYLYIHAYSPSNTKCIGEVNALAKLYGAYGSKVEFITLYLEQPKYNETEKRALDKITWKKIGLSPDDPVWNQLALNSYPNYILVDKELNVVALPALSPTPNGKYETIEKTFFELSKP